METGGKMAAGSADNTQSGAVRDRLIVVDDFLPPELAEAMRLDIDTHFSNPAADAPATHQVWNYWFVPELYTYLRTQPEKVINPGSVRSFLDHLSSWSTETLGLSRATWPYLSLYVGGCRQNLHNDAANGRFGYVYSLTRNERQTVGGQTIVHHAGDPVRAMLARPAAGRSFYDSVEPAFNRLVLFDDRLPHAVERVDGSMDPRQGRFVLHGHISEGLPVATGALGAETLMPSLAAALEAFARSTFIDGYHGPLVLRLAVGPDGVANSCRVVLDRVMHAVADDRRWHRVLADLMAAVSSIAFPVATGPTAILLPISFGQAPPVPRG